MIDDGRMGAEIVSHVSRQHKAKDLSLPAGEQLIATRGAVDDETDRG